MKDHTFVSLQELSTWRVFLFTSFTKHLAKSCESAPRFLTPTSFRKIRLKNLHTEAVYFADIFLRSARKISRKVLRQSPGLSHASSGVDDSSFRTPARLLSRILRNFGLAIGFQTRSRPAQAGMCAKYLDNTVFRYCCRYRQCTVLE